MLTFNCTCLNGSKQFARVSFTDMLFLKRLKHRTSAKSVKVKHHCTNEVYLLYKFTIYVIQLFLQQLYQTLGVNEDCEDETLRLAFIHLAKQFHPDSGASEADAVRFAEVRRIFQICCQFISSNKKTYVTIIFNILFRSKVRIEKYESYAMI